MALVGSALEGLIIAQCAASGILGVSTPQLAKALSLGISLNILATAQVITVDAGTAGAGVGTSTVLGISAGILGPLMVGNFASVGMVGPFSAPLALAISQAFGIWFLTNQTTTIHAGVGLGAGTGKVVGLVPATMGTQIQGFMASFGLLGTFSPLLAQAVALSICTHILATGIVVTPIAGPPSIVPAAGSGNGKIL
jgi:hypothetical protein